MKLYGLNGEEADALVETMIGRKWIFEGPSRRMCGLCVGWHRGREHEYVLTFSTGPVTTERVGLGKVLFEGGVDVRTGRRVA